MYDRKYYREVTQLQEKMWDDPLVRHYQDLHMPENDQRSIFLAGPSSRHDLIEVKWRIHAVSLLRELGYDGVIFVPEPRDNNWGFKETYETTIRNWESERLLGADVVVFWIPREQTLLPGRVTNTELGFLAGMAYAKPNQFKSRVVIGTPPEAWKVESEKHYSEIAGIEVYDTLGKVCIQAIRRSWGFTE